jgi:Fibronectin type III domain
MYDTNQASIILNYLRLIQMSVPGVPTQFVGNYTTTNDYIDFSWTASTGSVLYYYIYYYPSVGIGNTVYVAGTEVAYRFENVTYGLQYTFRISASNEYGESLLSDPTPSFSIIGLPTPPYNVTAFSRPGETRTTVSWFPPTNLLGSTISYYIVRVYTNHVLMSTHQTNSNTTSLLFTDLSFGTLYNFSVAALTNAGETAFSLQSSNFILTPSFPSAPTNVVATQNHDSADVSWFAPNSNGSPIIYYTIIDSFNQIQVRTPDASTTFNVSNLQFNTTYYFQVYATNGIGQSLYSNPATTFLLTNLVPDPPTQIMASSVPGNTTATVSWLPGSSNGSDILSYTLTYGSNHLTTTTPSIVLYDLSFQTVYTFVVEATNSIGTSVPSAPSSPFSLTPSVPDAPTNLQATSTAGSTSATLTWTRPYAHGSTITGYNILITPSEGSPSVSFIGGDVSTGVVQFLQFGVVYKFEVCAVSDIGNSAYSAPVEKFTLFGPPTAPYNLSVSMNPNPTETPSIQLFWNTPILGSPILSYQLVVYIDGIAKGIITCPSNKTNTIIQYLSYNTSYRFIMKATNQYGTGPVSNITQPIVIMEGPPVFPPTHVRGIVDPGHTDATILWNDPTGDHGGLPIVSHTIQLTDVTAVTVQRITI